ncbi:MAG: UDP-N-acetyl glucosamine 2-epimerase [Candidatus Hadarchaeum sp.]
MSKKTLTIHLICAARPNFMKVAPLYHALKKEEWASPIIVHTGQHYDLNMSDVFFEDLGLPPPHIHLGVGSGTHAEQTGKIMIAYERVIFETKPDLVVVVGDVNSTLACTLAAAKVSYGSNGLSTFNPRPSTLGGQLSNHFWSPETGNRPPSSAKPLPITEDVELTTAKSKLGLGPLVAHLEAGLRSFDRSMPEEINRIVTDSLADILWTPSPDADQNLLNEGVSPDRILRVGNIMIDSLEMLRDKIEQQSTYNDFHLPPNTYGLVTIHRPSNVDEPQTLRDVCAVLNKIAQRIPLIFPIHPRTRKNLHKYDLLADLEKNNNLFLPEPISYVRFMNLVFNCRLVITDSGGIQEETTYLGIPCLTLRPNTERPITLTQGTNKLCTIGSLQNDVDLILNSKFKTQDSKLKSIEYWDGHTAERIVEHIKQLIARSEDPRIQVAKGSRARESAKGL